MRKSIKVKNVCLWKVNDCLGWKRFSLSGFVDFHQYQENLQLSAELGFHFIQVFIMIVIF